MSTKTKKKYINKRPKEEQGSGRGETRRAELGVAAATQKKTNTKTNKYTPATNLQIDTPKPTRPDINNRYN